MKNTNRLQNLFFIISPLTNVARSSCRSFVGKLRGTSVSKSGSNSRSNSRPNTAEKLRTENLSDAAKLLGVELHRNDDESRDENDNDSATSYDDATEQLSSDDPWEIVRKLLVKCETSHAENKMLKKHLASGDMLVGSGSDDSTHSSHQNAGMESELKSLRKEVSNRHA